MANNVFGQYLIACSNEPLTGFYRDGCCNSDDEDAGLHTVCAVMTDDFLAYSKSKGNDLSTPHPEYMFPGLKAGDRWCLCAERWVEAYGAGMAPLVVLEATHERTLDFVDLKELVKFAWKNPQVVG
jgi:uncharacterized protein (DUF2237 family)